MSRESPEHVPSQAGHVSSSSRRPSLSYGNDSTLDLDYPSPQQSPSSPSSPSHLPDSTSMGAAQEKVQTSGSHRSRSGSRVHDASSDSKGKRKRSRVTPEQLAHLERFFAADRSPTAARRKEISEMLGMQERQTQIWFQNRRAKAKLLDGKHDQETMELPPDMPPALAAGWDAELQMLVHEDEPITIIPCTELSIGTWRRLASAVGKYDLVAYICHRRQRLAWFIYSSGCGFKMEVPFETVIDTKFVNSTPGMGQASFILSQPPHFFIEVASQEVAADGLPIRIWKPSTDWTEKMQATKVFRHDLIGAAIQLAHVLRTIAASKSGPSVPLYPLSYDSSYTSAQSSSSAGLPPATLTGAVADGIAGPSQPQQSNSLPQQRRFSRTSLYYQEPPLELPAGAATSNSLRTTYHSLPPRSSPVIPTSPYAVSSDPGMRSPPPIPSDPSMGPSSHYQHLQVPISQTISRRSLSGPSSPQGDVVFGNDEMSLTPSISYRGRRSSASSDSVSPTSSLTQSMSSLSTTPSHPPSAWDNRRTNAPPSTPYLLASDYGSAAPSPHPGYSPQNFH